MRPDYAGRRARVRARFSEVDCGAVWIASPANIRYLTGFTGSNGIVLLTDQECILGTDGRYVTQCEQECEDVRLIVDRDTVSALSAAAQGRLAIEASHVSVAQHRVISASAETVEIEGWVEGVRVIKEPVEEAWLRTACEISDAALTDVLPHIREGISERRLARLLEGRMLDLGADAIAFDSIVAFGENSAIPHHSPTDTTASRGDLIKIDFGAQVAGYHADQTRTFVLGSPAAWQIEIHSVVAAAQAAGRHALRSGTTLRDVDVAARSIISEAGYADAYPHGLGHGVGLEIHEAPMIGARATGILMGGVPVTIEPGVYLPGRGGVRIEDTMWVTESGSEPLTRLSRELCVL